MKVDGNWRWKHFSSHTNWITFDLSRHSWSIVHKNAGHFGYNSQGYFESTGGLDSAKIDYISKLKSEHHEAIRWMVDKMKMSKCKGFYDDVIEGLNKYS